MSFPVSDTPASSSSSSFALNNAGNNGSNRPQLRKTSLFRRHSFNVAKDKQASASASSNNLDSSPARESSSSGWYEADIESEGGQRSNAAFDEAHSFSDSEGGATHQLPLRSRIRGLFGSFGKGRKKVHRSNSKRREHQVLCQQVSVNSTCSDVTDGGPMLKATLGEFTRQIESLSAKSEQEELFPRQKQQPAATTTYYTAHVTATSSTAKSMETSLDRSHHHHHIFSRS